MNSVHSISLSHVTQIALTAKKKRDLSKEFLGDKTVYNKSKSELKQSKRKLR